MCWLVFFWIIVGGVVGAVIDGKNGRSPVVGFVVGGLLGPVFVWLFLMSKPKGRRKCPYCAEQVKREAVICKHCQQRLPALTKNS